MSVTPRTMRAFVSEEYRESFVEIYEATPERRLITCIEVLSPSNKRPGTEGWELYQRKRQNLLLSDVNLVELDLLRGGKRMPMLDPWPDCPYTLLVSRAALARVCKVWPAHFRSPVPALHVPLAKPDADLQMELQPMLNNIYKKFRYAQSIDYEKPLAPPLRPRDATWLKKQLRTLSQPK